MLSLGDLTPDFMNALERRADSDLLCEANRINRMKEKATGPMREHLHEHEVARRVVVCLRTRDPRPC